MSKPSVKMAEKLPTDLQETFIRKAQQINAERMSKANMIKARNRLSGVIMAAVVGSIYAYTLFTVKQATFLDELDDPEPAAENK